MLILASQSPRRVELLKHLNIPFKVIPSKMEEIIDEKLSINDIPASLAKQKALTVFADHKNDIIIGSDTIVVIDKIILGKPKDKKDAKRMLTLLSNKTHKVITGVCIVSKDKIQTFTNISEVSFIKLSETDIDNYLMDDEYIGKAGSYAIQGKSALFIKNINGDYYSVMGLPISELNLKLKQFI